MGLAWVEGRAEGERGGCQRPGAHHRIPVSAGKEVPPQDLVQKFPASWPRLLSEAKPNLQPHIEDWII